MSRYFIHNFGCRASAADGDAIAAMLEGESGLKQGLLESAHVVVVNTCSVTAEAERSARAMIRRVRRVNPDARVVVTGCYAQRAPEEIRALPGIDAIIGNSHKGMVARAALEALRTDHGGGQKGFSQIAGHAQEVSSAEAPAAFVPLSRLIATLHTPFSERTVTAGHADGSALPISFESKTLRTRPILKVQDGCGNRCSFCVIPETRGASRSVALDEVVNAAKDFTDRGGQELVLSGINLGRWGRDLQPAHRLPMLVQALLATTELPRLRLSSVEPMDWTTEMLDLFAHYGHGKHPRLAPHAHLPLQSGADEILRRMHRRYRPWHYAEKVQALRQILPEAAIGADVMVGFPGETETLFQQSYDFIEAQPFTYLHLFPFSARPRTVGEALHHEMPVPGEAVRKRMQALEALAQRKQAAFRNRFIGQAVSAVTLQDGTALTDNFLQVELGRAVLPNQLLSIQIASVYKGKLQGVPEVLHLDKIS